LGEVNHDGCWKNNRGINENERGKERASEMGGEAITEKKQ
jgi:hypothetical protein